MYKPIFMITIELVTILCLFYAIIVTYDFLAQMNCANLTFWQYAKTDLIL